MAIYCVVVVCKVQLQPQRMIPTRIQLESDTLLLKPCLSDNDIISTAYSFPHYYVDDCLRSTADEDAAPVDPDMGGVDRLHDGGDVVSSVLTEAAGHGGGGMTH